MSTVRIVCGDDVFDVEEKYVEYSGYLLGNLSWNRTNGLDTIILEDIEDTDLLRNYLNFLIGDSFSMEEKDEVFFGFMGHTNSFKFPLHIWKMKLRNKWIRDNFYKYDLASRDDGLYGLVEIPIINNIVGVEDADNPIPIVIPNVTVAGGAALYMSGYTSIFSDVDLFPLDKKTGIDYATKYNLNQITSATAGGVMWINTIEGENVNSVRSAIQLIKRQYSCPAEIVHGFDIDCTGFVAVDVEGVIKLYATELALYSASTMTIWYDPEFVEERYYWRLSKYVGRGFKLHLPMIHRSQVSPYSISSTLQRREEMAQRGTSADSKILRMLPPDARIGVIIMSSTGYHMRDVKRSIGTLLVLMSFFSVSYNKKDAIYDYMVEILGEPKVASLVHDPYADKRDNKETRMDGYALNDWVEKQRVVLRMPFESKFIISSPQGLLNMYRDSGCVDIPEEVDEVVEGIDQLSV
jgi:hypothetical protein